MMQCRSNNSFMCDHCGGTYLPARHIAVSERRNRKHGSNIWLRRFGSIVPTSFLVTNVACSLTHSQRELNLKVNRSWITIKFTHRCEPYWFRYSFYWKLCVNYHLVQFIVEVYYPALRHLNSCGVSHRHS